RDDATRMDAASVSGYLSSAMKRSAQIFLVAMAALLSSCAGSGSSFCDWSIQELGTARITESITKTIVLANPSEDKEQHLLGVAFDRGTNVDGHFRMDSVKVGNQEVSPNDVVVPPGGVLSLTVTYSPVNLESTKADWGGWVTGRERRWIPVTEEEYERQRQEEAAEPVVHRAIIQAVYDHPNEGIYYVQVVGYAEEGPNGEISVEGGGGSCTPGGGTACFTGGFSLDLPTLAPGGPKPLEMTGPIKFETSGGSATLRMDDFPYVIYYLRSDEIPELPSGVNATLVLSGGQGAEATGTFDGSRIELSGVVFRIRVALGEMSAEEVKAGMSALVDFEVGELEITTIKPLSQNEIAMRLETSLPQNPSGNALFDQFLSGAKVIALMEGELAL
ncbi:MAG TPA: hypothetical protein PLY45_05515, partial [bacterium]|nr:hypothetical protein [bacterium]